MSAQPPASLSQERTIAWLEQTWGDRPCPYCRKTAWQVGEAVEIALARKAKMAPSFPIICGNCGHMTLISSTVVG